MIGFKILRVRVWKLWKFWFRVGLGYQIFLIFISGRVRVLKNAPNPPGFRVSRVLNQKMPKNSTFWSNFELRVSIKSKCLTSGRVRVFKLVLYRVRVGFGFAKWLQTCWVLSSIVEPIWLWSYLLPWSINGCSTKTIHIWPLVMKAK